MDERQTMFSQLRHRRRTLLVLFAAASALPQAGTASSSWSSSSRRADRAAGFFSARPHRAPPSSASARQTGSPSSICSSARPAPAAAATADALRGNGNDPRSFLPMLRGLSDFLSGLLSGRSTPAAVVVNDDEKSDAFGTVLRAASRSYHPQDSVPSSRRYTTRKDPMTSVAVTQHGVTGDYNHYRTVALKGTTDRAVSIWTSDALDYIRTVDGGSYRCVTEGDLGENLFVGGTAAGYKFFEVGKRYRFGRRGGGSGGDDYGSGSGIVEVGMGAVDEEIAEGVVLQITEPVVPCANLCKLPCINDEALPSGRERVKRCQLFIQALEKMDGLRGWYAKVVVEGTVHVGDAVTRTA